jgi:FixJ family two-component response regulator
MSWRSCCAAVGNDGKLSTERPGTVPWRNDFFKIGKPDRLPSRALVLKQRIGGAAIDRRSTVFIVDDDPIGVEPLRILLKWRLGVDAVVYDRPDLFVAAFDPSRAGCLLLDLAMPEMSGPEVLEHLARRTVLPPTIILTSDGLSSGLARALRAGAVDYFVKPVDPDRLVASVREALDLDRRRKTMSPLASARR